MPCLMDIFQICTSHCQSITYSPDKIFKSVIQGVRHCSFDLRKSPTYVCYTHFTPTRNIIRFLKKKLCFKNVMQSEALYGLYNLTCYLQHLNVVKKQSHCRSLMCICLCHTHEMPHQ